MGRHEDKENAVWSESNVPVTPRHLLSRSQSFMKNKSPKRAEARRPLASKDNNRSVSYLGTKEPLRKRTRPGVNHAGSFVGNARLGPAPTLSASGAPKIKSLVLKDGIEEEGSQSEGGEDDDDESNRLAAKLRTKLLSRDRDADGEQIGLLGGAGGLQSLLGPKLSQRPEESDSDQEVEVIPPRPEPIPHVPEGYTPFAEQEIAKLQGVDVSPFQLNFSGADEDEDINSQDSTQLFTLNFDRDDNDDSDADQSGRKRHHTPERATHLIPMRQRRKSDAFELEPSYAGDGLTVEELESLLE
ncbi:LAQU0S25e00936g1_1 [Lachancea quebecensis]|uniref:LAQU0S25e00936g1_1 n=1 Tax=Lachancea quebecensis TaxID=1654605 RepID=A0A0P1KXV8_9SACH|nr:LAQU0S25e00936g1_1 [Lachancea quebecensis]